MYACISAIFPLFLAKKEFHAMYMFGAINVVLFLYVRFWIVETMNVPLKEIDQLFGGDSHVEDSIEMKYSTHVEEVISESGKKDKG
jgi:hypothetical protein